MGWVAETFSQLNQSATMELFCCFPHIPGFLPLASHIQKDLSSGLVSQAVTRAHSRQAQGRITAEWDERFWQNPAVGRYSL